MDRRTKTDICRSLINDSGMDALFQSSQIQQLIDVSRFHNLHTQHQIDLIAAFPNLLGVVPVKDFTEPMKSRYFGKNPNEIEKYTKVEKLSKQSYSIILNETKGYNFLFKRGIDYAKVSCHAWTYLLKKHYDVHSPNFLAHISRFDDHNLGTLVYNFPKLVELLIPAGIKIPKHSYQRLFCHKHSLDIVTKFPVQYNKLSSYEFDKIMCRDPVAHEAGILENLNMFVTPTDLRYFLNRHPSLLSKITADNAIKSPLNAKHWILLKKYERIKNMSNIYNKDFEDWLELQVSVDVLSGKSKTSAVLKRAQAKA